MRRLSAATTAHPASHVRYWSLELLWSLVFGAWSFNAAGVALPVLSETFDDVEHHWDKKNGNQSRGQHPADDGRADDASAHRACSRGPPERHASQDEGERGHDDRT